MAGAIKGITVEIGGETSGLDKALRDVNKQSASIAKELKEVDKLLDFDGSNVDILAQKQELLGKAVETAAEKVQKLHDVQAEVEEQFKSGKISGEAYRDFQREVAKAEAALRKAEEKVESFGKETDTAADNVKELTEQTEKTADAADDAGGKYEKLGSVLKTVGSGIAATTTAIGAGATAAVTAVAGAITSMAELAEETREYRTNTGKLDTTFEENGFSAEQASNTYKDFYAVLGDEGQATEAVSFLAKMAKSQEDLTDWTTIATGVYATFGASLPIEGLTEAANETSKTGTVTGGLADALNWAAKEGETFGVTLKENTKENEEWNKAVSEAATAEDYFNLALSQCTTEQERQALITETLSGLYSDAAESYRENNGELLKANEAAASYTDAMAKIGGVMEPVVTSVKSGAAEVVSSFADMVEQAASGGDISESMVESLETSITSMIDEIAEQVPGILDAVDEVFGAVLNALDGATPEIIHVVQDIITKLMKTASSMLPEILTVVVSILTAISESFMAEMPGMTTAITTAITTMVAAIIDNLPNIINTGVQIITSLISGIAQALPELIPAAEQAITAIVQGLVDQLPQILEAALQIVLALAEGLLEALPQLIAALPQIITGIVDFIIDAVPQIVEAGITLLTSLVDALPDIITAIVNAIPQIIDGVVNGILDALPEIIAAGVKLFSALAGNLPEVITKIVEAMPELIGGIVDALMKSIPLLIEAGIALFVAIASDIPAIIDGITAAVPDIIAGIVKALIDSRQKMKDVGDQLIQGLWEGISNAKDWLFDKIGGFFDGVVDNIKDFFGIHSPSTLFRDEIGKYLAEGIGIGFSDEMENVSKDMQDALPKDFDTAVNAAYEYSTGDDGERNFELVTPISIGGQKLTKVVSRVQYNTKLNRARVVGVSAE